MRVIWLPLGADSIVIRDQSAGDVGRGAAGPSKLRGRLDPTTADTASTATTAATVESRRRGDSPQGPDGPRLWDVVEKVHDCRDRAIGQLRRAIREPAIEYPVHVRFPVHAVSPVAATRKSASIAARICCLA